MKSTFRLLTALFFVAVSTLSAGAQRGFAIVIDPKSYAEARQELTDYAAAIEQKQGLKVFTVIDRWGVPDSIRAELVRLHVQKKHPIEGAVLIGDIPVAMVRDAQHLTSAFKMNQKTDRRESSVPSDRYYDDFNLRFQYIDKDADEPYFYYSLTAESAQRLAPTIYSGRIRPTDAGSTSRYEKLRSYLRKATAAKMGAANTLDQMLIYGGHGYISESMVARMDEKQNVYEHFPWMKGQQSHISFIDHSQENPVKFRLMNELMRPDMDYAILHHHGSHDTQYLNGLPNLSARDPQMAKSALQTYCRSKLREAKRRGKNVDSIRVVLEKRYDIPPTWLDDAFDEEAAKKDSIDDANLDLHLADFNIYSYQPNCRFVIIDACFCGSYHRDDCIANEYIFGEGQTVACMANSVNVLQDKWGDRFIGLLGMGAPVGCLTRLAPYLEQHLIGDPTFAFAPSISSYDVGRLLGEDKTAAWRKLLKDASTPADLRCLAIKQLYAKRQMTSDELLTLFRSSTEAVVRAEALNTLADIKDDNAIAAIALALDDGNEMVQRYGIKHLGRNGDDRLIPALIRLSISNNTSERCNFNAMSALSFYPEDKLIAEFERQFGSTDVKYIDKQTVGATIEKALRSSANKWQEYVDSIIATGTSDKVRRMSIRTLRNYLPHHRVPELLDYLQTSPQEEMQTMLLEALGWHRPSCKSSDMAAVAKQMSTDSRLTEAVRREALKTYNRLK